MSDQVVYICTVTGAENGLPDLVLPISSFQSRRRSGTDSYLKVTSPSLELYDAAAARPDGDVVVTLAHLVNGTVIPQGEVARVNFGDLGFSKEANAQTVTLSGTKQVTYASPKAVAPTSATSLSLSGGKWRAGIAIPDISINPGDTVTVGSASFVAGLITTSVSIDSNGNVRSTMGLSEA